MELPDGRPLIVDAGILCETAPEGRVVLWVPGERGGGSQHWDRVGTVAHAAVEAVRGVRAVEAASVPARQRLGGTLGTWLRALAGARPDRAWTLPGGATAEACGERRAGLRLAWADDGAAPLDEARVRARWPGCGAIRPLGPGLFLVAGVGPEPERAEAGPVAEAMPPPPPPQETHRALAERAREAARAGGDPHREVAATIDLGLALLAEGDPHRAARLIKQALDDVRRLRDPALEADALASFALAALDLGHADRARDLLAPVIVHARALGDRYAEKLALDRLAQALLALGDREGALARLEQAAALAAVAGDGRHEADLLWRAAVEHAELGRRDRAAAAAAAAVDCFRRLGHPAADWYAQHLADYRAGAVGGPHGLGTPASAGPADPPARVRRPAPPAGAAGPGLLRQAQTAVKAMATFVGSGFKTAPAQVYRSRLDTCSGCAHHTGVRCRACGCVTAVKARLLHERCPAGRWPV